MSTETELKFRIPPQRLAALRRALATATAQRLTLAAVYFDTPGEQLARARVALRLRREGAGWVQTLKAEGASAMQRLEHNVALPGSRRPVLDIARHDGSAAGAVLRRLLAGARGEPLQVRYSTEVQRTLRRLRLGGALVELALDEGEIRAGSRSLPVCEIEFELLSGTPQALLGLAARWVDRFGLVLDVRSKSERGHWLAAGRSTSPPARARPLALAASASPAQALAAMLSATLGQALANASQLTDAGAEPEHLHQLRVGLRRLRSVLRLFGTLAPPADAGLATALAGLFGQLGAARDRDALVAWLGPALQAAGGPALVLPAGDPADLAALLRSTATQQLWLAALAASLPTGPAPGGAAAPLREQLARPLRRLLRQVQRDARRFAEIDDPARHRLRRRIKRLRYGVEAVASLWPARLTAPLLDRLQQAQAPLGEYNDTLVALAHCRALAGSDPQAWFAVGWLSARRDALRAPCAEALAPLAALHRRWPR